jgi:hypothetical protein
LRALGHRTMRADESRRHTLVLVGYPSISESGLPSPAVQPLLSGIVRSKMSTIIPVWLFLRSVSLIGIEGPSLRRIRDLSGIYPVRTR